ncbi:MAG TPA: helix-turn-helix domain-containing protein [Planctomycetaceae bacterium]|nr:helix-turn-helix domain-containing protein [Planctomycetaceae bacterium]
MQQEHATDFPVERWLETLGVDSLCQWDVLVFLYRRRASLVSDEHIARLLGYATGKVVAALDHLESLDLVERSRVSQAVRLYQFTMPDGEPPGSRGNGLHRLLSLADSRSGRMLLARKLRRDDRANHGGPSRRDRDVLRSPERSAPWLTAS